MRIFKIVEITQLDATLRPVQQLPETVYTIDGSIDIMFSTDHMAKPDLKQGAEGESFLEWTELLHLSRKYMSNAQGSLYISHERIRRRIRILLAFPWVRKRTVLFGSERFVREVTGQSVI